MVKSIVAIAAAVAIVSFGSLLSAPAQAGGGATSAPSKYNNSAQSQSAYRAQTTSYTITEFSSSSARPPKK